MPQSGGSRAAPADPASFLGAFLHPGYAAAAIRYHRAATLLPSMERHTGEGQVLARENRAAAGRKQRVKEGTMYRKSITLAAAAVLGLSIAWSGPAGAQWVRAGVLGCDVSAGFGFIIGSNKSVSCLFTPDVPGPQEYYVGTISKLGIDIGATAAQSMLWGVFVPTSWPGPGALAGNYVGATGQATVAVGLGANVLVGGSNTSIALQPVSVTGQTGLNVAVGVAELQLRPAR
jgi:Protein of unknown function (DUF992)